MSAPTPIISVQEFIDEIEKTTFFSKDKEIKGSLAHYIHFYERGAVPKKLGFWATAFVVIVLSATLPFVAAFGDRIFPNPYDNMIVALFGILIALSSGLNSFFHWDRSWRGYMNAMLTLQTLKSEWELKKVEAQIEPKPAQGLVILKGAVEKLIRDTNTVVISETQEFFTLIKFPEAKPEAQGIGDAH